MAFWTKMSVFQKSQFIKIPPCFSHPKLCRNCFFPQNFHTRILGEIAIFYAVLERPYLRTAWPNFHQISWGYIVMMKMRMNSFCGMVDRQKVLSLISSRDHCRRFSPFSHILRTCADLLKNWNNQTMATFDCKTKSGHFVSKIQIKLCHSFLIMKDIVYEAILTDFMLILSLPNCKAMCHKCKKNDLSCTEMCWAIRNYILI